MYGRPSMRTGFLIVLAATAFVPAAASPAAAAVRDCAAKADFNIEIVSARNMTCGAAKFDMRRYRGSIGFRIRTPAGFTCTRVSGNRLAGQWRCVKGTRAYRFDFSD